MVLLAEGLIGGFINVLQPFNLFVLFSAIVIGFFGGAVPGIGGAMLVVVLLPITYGMDSASAFLLLTAIYAATAYSGSISAILFRVPGTPEAIATVFDGYSMSQKGKTGEALGLAMTSSALGGIIGAIFLFLLATPLASFALRFSSPEYFALTVFGLTVVASLSGGDLLKGVMAVLFGLFIATVGTDSITALDRFTWNTTNLRSGLGLIPILTGLFAIPEVMKLSRQSEVSNYTFDQKFRTKLFSMDLIKAKMTVLRSSLIGVFIGILPGIGATTASLVSYSEEVRWSKKPELFGTGVPEGIIAPEAANNSASAGALIPLISLGIPGSATTALILGAFILHGLQPGPMFIQTNPVLVYTILAGMFLVNVMMMIFAKPFISIFANMVKIPYSFLAPIIIVFCFIGTFAVRNSMFDVWVMFCFGFIGYVFEKVKFPFAAIILGVVLGPIAEEQFRRALVIANGDYSVFFTRPISATLLALAILALLAPVFKKVLASRKQDDIDRAVQA